MHSDIAVGDLRACAGDARAHSESIGSKRSVVSVAEAREAFAKARASC